MTLIKISDENGGTYGKLPIPEPENIETIDGLDNEITSLHEIIDSCKFPVIPLNAPETTRAVIVNATHLVAEYQDATIKRVTNRSGLRNFLHDTPALSLVGGEASFDSEIWIKLSEDNSGTYGKLPSKDPVEIYVKGAVDSELAILRQAITTYIEIAIPDEASTDLVDRIYDLNLEIERQRVDIEARLFELQALLYEISLLE
jgi:hypothetical protein